MERKIIVERLADWSYGAFLDESSASCVAVGSTEEEARANAEVALKNNDEIVQKIMTYIASFNIQNPTFDRIKAILEERYTGISRS